MLAWKEGGLVRGVRRTTYSVLQFCFGSALVQRFGSVCLGLFIWFNFFWVGLSGSVSLVISVQLFLSRYVCLNLCVWFCLSGVFVWVPLGSFNLCLYVWVCLCGSIYLVLYYWVCLSGSVCLDCFSESFLAGGGNSMETAQSLKLVL